jgi:hypothetical protein
VGWRVRIAVDAFAVVSHALWMVFVEILVLRVVPSNGGQYGYLHGCVSSPVRCATTRNNAIVSISIGSWLHDDKRRRAACRFQL